MNTRFFFYLVIVLGLSACIDDVDSDNLPKTQRKLVVHSFVSPNDTVRVMVTCSKPINYNVATSETPWDPNNPTIDNALVVISDTEGKNRVEVPFDAKSKNYIVAPSAFQIVAGETYYLSISAPGLNAVSAYTTVPKHYPAIKDIRVDCEQENEWGGRECTVYGIIEDDHLTENFYSFQVVQKEEYGGVFYYEEYDLSLVSDASQNGLDIPFSIETWGGLLHSSYLFSNAVDRHYYRYHRSVEKYYEAGDNPFAEPVVIYSNVEKGLGVFGSFNPTVDTLGTFFKK